MPGSPHWNPTLYQTRHSFVWEHAEDLLALLDAKPGERILDVGCGTAQLTAKLAAAGAEVLGVDSSGEMIEQARANFPNLAFEPGDVRSLKVAAPFDAVSRTPSSIMPTAGLCRVERRSQVQGCIQPLFHRHNIAFRLCC